MKVKLSCKRLRKNRGYSVEWVTLGILEGRREDHKVVLR